jgi:hypothetical protein
MSEIMYFGEHCGPGIIIWDILNKRDKLLFMLGVFSFDKILSYLKDRNLHSIYDKNYLINSKNNKIKPNIKSVLKQNIHFDNPLYDNCIQHSKYGFIFLHDYIYLHNENTILNYDFIANQYKLKIENTTKLFNNNNPVLILNFLSSNDCNNVIVNNINEMIQVLNSYMPHKKYYLLFFTNFEIPNIYFDNVFFIKIEQNYNNWVMTPNNLRVGLYKEIYDKFYNITKKLNLHYYPVFEETYYYKNNIHNGEINTCGSLDF